MQVGVADKGMWMGGTVPHGYYVKDRKLLVDTTEAEDIRYIFTRYLKLKSILKLADDLAERGMRTRTRTMKSGKIIGNVNFGRGPINIILKNKVYIGKTKHKDAIYEGEHDAIIDAGIFEQVQSLIAANNHVKATSVSAKSPSLLAGLITDPDGRPMSPSRGQKGARQYCYYVTRFKPGEDRSMICRLPAGEVDRIVIAALVTHFKDSTQVDSSTCKVAWQQQVKARAEVAARIPCLPKHEQKALLLDAQARVHVTDTSIDVSFGRELSSSIISTPTTLVRRGNELRMSIAPDRRLAKDQIADPHLVRLVAQGFAAREQILARTASGAIGGYDQKHLNRLIRVFWLAPDIISAILEGRQPVQLTARHLLRCANIPLDWQQQRSFLGFS